MIARIAGLLAALVAFGTLASCDGKPTSEGTKARVPPLVALTVRSETTRREQAWDGVVEAVHQVTITAQTNARVLELPHDVNDVVAKGDALVRFSDVEQKSARNSAQAQIVSTLATYSDAEASYQRYATIFAKGYVSKEQMDQQRARRDAARAALDSARAQLRQIEQALDYTVLRAPYAGIITRRYVQVGEAVQAGPPSPQPLIAMQSLDDLRVNVQVPQSAVAAIRRFHAADVLPGDDGVPRIAASSVNVFPYADPATHTFNVRLQLPSGDHGLYPGMTVKVAFATGEAKRQMVPASALVQRGEIVAVYVIGKQGVTLRQVRTGYHRGNRVEVLSGLDDGERIASDPVAAMKHVVAQRAAGASSHG